LQQIEPFPRKKSWRGPEKMLGGAGAAALEIKAAPAVGGRGATRQNFPAAAPLPAEKKN
jgi:hypothetical protein